jgi:hypothetical protein
MNMAPTLSRLRGSLPPDGADFPWGGPAENRLVHMPYIGGQLLLPGNVL